MAIIPRTNYGFDTQKPTMPDRGVLKEDQNFMKSREVARVKFLKKIAKGEFDKFIIINRIKLGALKKEQITKSYSETFIKTATFTNSEKELFDGWVKFGNNARNNASELATIAGFLDALIESGKI